MTIPAPPLPELTSLLKLGTPPFRGERWADRQQGDSVWLYRRGSLALAAGVEAVRKAAGASSATLWIPGYFCNDALDPIRRLPVAMRFYPIQKDFTPDWKVLEERVPREGAPQVFVLVHYFGFPNAATDAMAFGKRHGMTIIEDAAHVLLPSAGIGQAEILVFSPRKLLAAPSGGLLVTRKHWTAHVVRDAVHGRTRDSAGWLIRRFAQRIMVSLHIPWHRFRPADQTASWRQTGGPGGDTQRACDPLALRLLAAVSRDLDEVAHRRQQNYVRLLEWTAPLTGARPLFPVLPEGVCPYTLPLLVQDGCEHLHATLQVRGIPASRWPDLPPEVWAAEGEHTVAIQTYERLLLLPIHQSLTLRQIDRMGQQLQRALATM